MLASIVQRDGPVPLVVGLFGSVMLVLLAEGLKMPVATPAWSSARAVTAVALTAQGVPIAGLSAFLCGVIGWRGLPRVAAAVGLVLGLLSLLRILPVELLAMLALVPASAASCSERTWARWLWLGFAVASVALGLLVWG